jgi:hypothetical protein
MIQSTKPARLLVYTPCIRGASDAPETALLELTPENATALLKTFKIARQTHKELKKAGATSGSMHINFPASQKIKPFTLEKGFDRQFPGRTLICMTEGETVPDKNHPLDCHSIFVTTDGITFAAYEDNDAYYETSPITLRLLKTIAAGKKPRLKTIIQKLP